MTDLTTIKVTKASRDQLKAIAEDHDLTLDGALQKLLRTERQSQMGRDLAERPSTADDQAWVAASTAAVNRAIG
jgi:hypothetical protein